MKRSVVLVTLMLMAIWGLEGAPFQPMSVLRVPDAWILAHKSAEMTLIGYYRDVSRPTYVSPDLNKTIVPIGILSVGLGDRVELGFFGGDQVYFFSAKAPLLKESRYAPQIAIGLDNMLSPVNRHRSQDYTPANDPDWEYSGHPDKTDYEYWSPYITASKHLKLWGGNVDLTVGIGANRFIGDERKDRIFNGMFWAVRPWIGKNLSLALEYSGQDFNAGIIGNIGSFGLKVGIQSFEDLVRDNGYEDNLRVALGVSYLFDKYSKTSQNSPVKTAKALPAGSRQDEIEPDPPIYHTKTQTKPKPEASTPPVTSVTKQSSNGPSTADPHVHNTPVKPVMQSPNPQPAPKTVTNTLQSESLFSKRKALVIGNKEYGQNSLRNPINDALAVTEALKARGFAVVTLTNADLERMNKETKMLLDQITSTDEVLFYYSGHGAQLENVNYLIPSLASIDEPEDLPYRAFNANHLMDRLNKARTSIVVLDACRDNPFLRSRSMSRGLAMANGRGNQIVIYSTAPGMTADDGSSGSNSPFTAEFVRQILNSDKQILIMMQDVVKAVKEKTGGKQVPWQATNLQEDFYFSKPTPLGR